MNDLPKWADPEASRSLPSQRARGEGPQTEFKVQFPSNASVLGKAIAAFSSTDGGGLILIGVSDEGDLIGIADGHSASTRDELMRRLENICHGKVKPAVTVLARWAIEDEKVVMAVTVPRGREPIYYSDHVPYVRSLTTNRPAEPNEVVDRVRRSLLLENVGQGAGAGDASFPDWVSAVAGALLPVLITGKEINDRMIDPWLSQWMAEFKAAAQALRDKLIESALPSELSRDAEGMVAILEELARFRMYLGCGPALAKLMAEARERAKSIWQVWVQPRIAGDQISSIREEAERLERRLVDLYKRGEQMLFGGESEEFQRLVSDAGLQLLRLTYLAFSEDDDAATDLFGVGHQLHLIETRRLYLDGGRSQQAILDEVRRLRDELLGAVEKISGQASPDRGTW